MRTIKEIITSQVEYTILQVVLDLLLQQNNITESEWKEAAKKLKVMLNPPTRMIEDYND